MNTLRSRLNRRQFTAGAVGSLAALATARVGIGQEASPDATHAAGWTFTDDAGTTISADAPPARIAAHITAAASLWASGIEPVAVWGDLQGRDGGAAAVGNVDLDAVSVVGDGMEYNSLDLEALALAAPDLIVTATYDYGDGALPWGIDEAVVSQVEQIAPIAQISVNAQAGTEVDVIERFVALAETLGADLTAPEIAESRERFDEAVQSVRDALAEKTDLMTMFVAGWPENFYVGNPEQAIDLAYFQSLGLDIVMPEAEEYWETLSWEEAGKYQTDLIFNDDRSGSLSVEEMLEFVTFASLPAVQEGQIGVWSVEYVHSYGGFAPVLEDLAATIDESRDDLV